MKHSLSLLTIGCFIAIAVIEPTSATQISISPQLDSLYIVGSCTPAEMICTLSDSPSGYDTITIQSRYSDPLCTDFPPNESNIIPAFHYIIHDTSAGFRYELWACPIEYDTAYAIKFDTAFMLAPQWYHMVLRVYADSVLVDTAQVRLRSINTGLSVERMNNLVPSKIVLEQNYPNPFNPSTFIPFSVPSEAFVSLKVFDLNGREVANIINENISAGYYRVHWEAQHLPSGIYFCRLQSGNYLQTKKLCLLR
jgi:hypothetical protein